MATISRQPFAPLDGARLQNLTSLKNRQNASSNKQSPAGGKRKAELLDVDDSENVDPLLFAKRSKGANPSTPAKDIFKPSSFVLTKAPALAATSTPTTATPLPDIRSLGSPSKASSTPRRILQARSPAARLNTAIAKSSPISAPAGRSPTRGKRSGILNRRRSGPYSRVDPPSFSLSSGAPFSLDAALKGTIPGYESRAQPTRNAVKETIPELHQDEMKPSWFFDIHEDTPEQEMTNLLQHSTCTLDISSDEESEQKARREKDEGRDKENVPPVDDVSQTSSRRAAHVNADDMVVEKERVALGEMNTADFYAEGCDETSVIIIPEDEEESEQAQPQLQQVPEDNVELPAATVENCELASEPKDVAPGPITPHAVDALMEQASTAASVLQPIEGTGESFELWESGSAKDEAEVTVESS
ncbi:hypothetical protein HJFPF1_11665 [Paramyrothecium foliicola]|nr:hypothetical protein HJFPF1_11665 [Paramyrothecium foliicola]